MAIASNGTLSSLWSFLGNAAIIQAMIHKTDGAMMVDEVKHLLIDLDEENERLEQELTSPSSRRLTEYAVARHSPDPTLRRVGHIAESLDLGISELAGPLNLLPSVQ